MSNYKPIYIEFVNPVRFGDFGNSNSILKIADCNKIEIDGNFLKIQLIRKKNRTFLIPMINVAYMEIKFEDSATDNDYHAVKNVVPEKMESLNILTPKKKNKD